MEKLKALAASTQPDMQKLSDEVQKVFEANGYATAANCRTVCRVTVGPDGKPVVSCELICDW